MSSIADPSVDEAAIGAINDAAGYCRTLWATFIGYAATIFVLTSGTTHEALLRRTPVKLPLFNVDSGIPLLLFYVIAPLLLVLFHLNLLMKLHDLRVRVSELIIPLNWVDETNAAFERSRLRRRLMAFDYAVLKAGLVTDRRERLLLRVVTNVTIFIMPVVLLLFVQLQFLPYHDGKITWLHRSFVMIDLGLIAYIQLWLGMKGGQTESEADAASPVSASQKWRSLLTVPTFSFKPRKLAMGLLFGVPVLLSVFVLAFPGEPQDVFWKAASPSPYAPLAGADVAENFGIRRSLYLANRILWAQDPSEDLLQTLNSDATVIALRDDVEGVTPQLLRTVQRIHNAALTLRGRNLSFANFESAALIAADFSPNLNNEQMGIFIFRDETGENLPANSTVLTGASFSRADLRGVNFTYADARRVDFRSANLQSAVLQFGKFQAADFRLAKMQNATLDSARLQLADLSDARLEAADLTHAELQGAGLHGTAITSEQLRDAKWEGAMLDAALLEQLKAAASEKAKGPGIPPPSP